MKKTIYLLLFLLLLPNTALAIDTPENFTAIPDIDHVHLSWDSVPGAVGYNITFPQPTIRDLNGLTPPVIDGVLDTDVANYSQKGILRTPNPIDSLDYDSLYAVTDATYLYLGADTIDNDTNALDDYIGVWFDFNQDGLTTDDVGYRLREDGTFQRQKWSGTAWIAFGGSGATIATGGAGTNRVVYEFRIPLSEIPVARGNYIDLVVRRTHTFGATVQTFFPDSTADSITDPTGWQELYFSDNITEEPLLIFNTTDTHYDINGLDSYSWYRVFLTAYDGAIYSNNTSLDFVTLDYPTYTISGYVKDNVTQLGIEGATVTVTNTFPHGFDVTDANGFYLLEGLHNDTYTVTASADNYISASNVTVVSGVNVSDVNITLIPVPPYTDEQIYLPYQIYCCFFTFSVLLMFYAFLHRDFENYTHILAAALTGIINIIIGMQTYIGIVFIETDLYYYSSEIFSRFHIGFGIVMFILTAVFIIDIARKQAAEKEFDIEYQLTGGR